MIPTVKRPKCAFIETAPGRELEFHYFEYEDLRDHLVRLRKLGSRARVLRVKARCG